MAHLITLGKKQIVRPMEKNTKNNLKSGYMLLILVFFVFLISIGLMIAVPVWQTQIKREMEEELIFRGNQFVEAIRIFQTKTPGSFPESFDELIEEKCLRRLYKDPMTASGEWNIILPIQEGPSRPVRPRDRRRSAVQEGIERAEPEEGGRGEEGGIQKVLIAPFSALSSIDNPQIIGVVSSSADRSIKIYNNQTSYNKWLFYYGGDDKNLPNIVMYGQEQEKEEKD